ncbi:hypothetical protein GCM10029978_063040 [Actinoallomurus acanthiterrae]
MEAGRNPHDEELIALVGELSTRSELFRQRWASQDVRLHRSGRKRVHHPVVGQLDLDVESVEMSAEPGVLLNVYTSPAGTTQPASPSTNGTATAPGCPTTGSPTSAAVDRWPAGRPCRRTHRPRGRGKRLFSTTDKDTQKLKLIEHDVYANGLQKQIFDVIH